MKKLSLATLVVSLAVTACNTVKGIGKDISSASTTVQNALR